MTLRKCQTAWSPKSGLLKVPDGLDPQVWSFESARQFRDKSLALRMCQTA